MNRHLQSILNIIQQGERLSAEEKNSIATSLKDADKELEITAFKLDKTEKVKRTTAVLLEETIEELEQKRKAVETQNRDLEIEASLERVRSMAMGMREPGDLPGICKVLFAELHNLGFNELRNAMINIHDDDAGSFLNYDYSHAAGPTVTTIFYNSHPATQSLIRQIRKSNDTFAEFVIKGNELDEWREYRKKMGEKDDPRLDNVTTLSYYFYSIGTGAIGISTYSSITEEKLNVLKRFRNVFDFAYRRYTDVTQAEGQAREAKIEAALERIRSKTMAMHQSIELREVVATIYDQLQYLDITYGACTIIIIDKESGDMEHWVGGFTQKTYPESYHVNYFSHPFYEAQLAHWKNGEKYVVLELSGEMKKTYDQFMFTKTDFKNFPEQEKKWMKELQSVVFSIAYMNHGALTWGPGALSEDHSIILQRFAKVFEQTYTRFLDLKKAEAQAREAQIEVSLERVRSKAMAMQKSEDLAGAVATVFEELDKLNLGMLRCGIGILDKLKCSADVWTTTKSDKGTIVHVAGNEPMNIHPLLLGAFNAWLNQEEYYSYVLQGEDLSRFYKAVADTNFQLPGSQSIMSGTSELKQYYFVTTFQSGGLYAFRETPFPEEAKTVMKRFADVFNLTYTRFNDLKYAEAQAREAKIEVALERVRAKALAMQTPNDLLDVANVLRRQMGSLGQPELESSIVHIYNDDSETFEAWYAYSPPNHSPDHIITDVANVPKDSSLWAREVIEKYKSADTEYTIEASGQKLTEWYKVLEKIAPVVVEYDDYGKLVVPAILYYHFSNFSGGSLLMISNQPPSREARELQKRAAITFDLAYTRFLDLQKAEAQAREAQIEAALERVRAKAMAMHNSEDLAETIHVFYQQMGLLNLMPRRCGVGLFDKEAHSADLIGMIISEQGEAKEITGKLKLGEHPVLKNVYDNWLLQQEYHPVLRGSEIKEYYQFIGSRISFENYPEDAVQFGYFFFFPEGAVYAWTEKELVEDELKIYRRFTSVLSLTYKRYKDLKLAEAQTRQAQIETAMEKVRARALAMQKPEELIEVAQVLRKEMGSLGVEELETSSIYILDEASGKTECWYAIKDNREPGNKLVADHMIMELPETWVGRQMLEFYKSGEKQISIPMQGAQRKEWIEYCSKQSQVLDGFYGESIPERTYHLNKFSNGYIGAASPGNISSESWELLQRATSVFSLAYTRFSDLQQAEAQAREAIKASSLDRIRAEIASMRTTDDLQRITPSVWKELTVLGVPFFRCGVFIINEKEGKAHIYLSTPGGKPLAVLHLDFDSSGVIRNAAEHWRIQKVYTEHWNREQFVAWVKSLVGQGQIEAVNTYQAGDEPPESLTLQFVPFAQGMLYVGSAEALAESRIELVHALANAFSVAYARYEDFKKLEDAKSTVEKTLAELKATQSQLIQAEKMASLGELTAGIAHEIQNPLNFVNNFSEVSGELLDEMINELGNDNKEDAIAIADDVKQNLEKILHHGKRADGIVKGMLQHSRSSNSIKEPTDINKLCDEYLRLAYHGLRAKDKSFNAILKTDYDNSIGNVNLIPQDIGRVILNLITNAFYAIAEKNKTSKFPQPGGEVEYEPTFSVSTKKIGDKIEISVKDNGNGIPEKVLAKIFQPFFTTKPTGQGTGLGLSLSYDIVKAHGGELKVKTQEGEGAEFIIQLPTL